MSELINDPNQSCEPVKGKGLPVRIAELQAKLAAAEHGLEEANRKVDHLLQHCKDYECSVCSEIACKHHEPLHFHHDGCPACILEHTPEKIGKAWLMDSSLERWFPITAERLAAAEKQLEIRTRTCDESLQMVEKLKAELLEAKRQVETFKEGARVSDVSAENYRKLWLEGKSELEHEKGVTGSILTQLHEILRSVTIPDNAKHSIMTLLDRFEANPWHSPEEWEQVQKECAEMREALESERHEIISSGRHHVEERRLFRINNALSTTAGKGFVRVEELELALRLLDQLGSPVGSGKRMEEYNRLQALVKGQL